MAIFRHAKDCCALSTAPPADVTGYSVEQLTCLSAKVLSKIGPSEINAALGVQVTKQHWSWYVGRTIKEIDMFDTFLMKWLAAGQLEPVRCRG